MPKRDYAALEAQIKEKYPDIAADLEEIVAGLKGTNEILKEERTKVEQRYKSDAEELAALRRWKEEADKSDAERKGEYEKIVQRERDKAMKLEQQWKQEREARHRNMIEAETAKALMAHRGNPDFLGHHLQQRLTVIEDNGREIVVALGQDGKPEMRDGKYVDAGSVVDTFKSDTRWAGAFEGANVSGYGTPSGSSRGVGHLNGSNPYKVEPGKLPNFTAQGELERANPALANQYRAEAGLQPLNPNLSLSLTP